MSLIIKMGNAKPTKSRVSLINDTRKHLRENVYPYLKDEMASLEFSDFLKSEAKEIRNYWERVADDEDAEWWKRWSK